MPTDIRTAIPRDRPLARTGVSLGPADGTASGRAGDRDDNTSSLLTVAAVALVVLLTAVAASTALQRSADVIRTRAEARAASLAVDVTAGMAEAVAAIETAGRVDADPEALGLELRTAARLPVFATVALMPSDGPPGELGDLVDDPAAVDAMAAARDARRAVVSAPLEASGGVVLVVRARYDRTDVAGLSPGSTAFRRAALSGHVIGVVRPQALIDDPDAQISDAGVLLAGPQIDEEDGAVAAAPVVDRRWRVAVDAPGPGMTPFWLVVGLGSAAVAVVLWVARSWRSLVSRRTAESAAERDRAGAVVTYAGVVQESHDLGEVLPALAVQLCDRLDLAGMSLGVVQDDGRIRELFVHGELPNRSVPAAPITPTYAGPGETAALHLRRAERSIGVLRIRCGRALDAGDFEQIRIAAELITSTVVASRSLDQQREAVDRLRSLDELKTAFLGTASHELRTPVTAISGFAYMLSDRWEALSDEQRRVFADRIASNARVLESLVQDLLDFARLERGALKLVVEEVDLAAVTERVLDRLEPVWSSHTVSRSIDPDARVLGDVPALERVVTNLVSNAVKFSPEGSVVAVRVDAGDPVTITIDDEGPGVPDTDRDRIFVRFFRGGGDAVVRTSGVGIGLAVVKDYVTQMGGEIRVENSPAGGARFIVELTPVMRYIDEERERTDVAT